MPQLHVAKANDCISNIALEHGFFPDTIWNDPDNADLRRVRPDPNVLRTGDLVVVPDKRRKEEDKPTDQRHQFRRRGTPATIHLRLLKNNKPRANEPYRLAIDGRIHAGTTDEDGKVWIFVPPNARDATLYVGEGKKRAEYKLALRRLQPVSELEGVQQRLNNLGYGAGPENGELHSRTVEALKRFQQDHELAISGKSDPETQAKLGHRHGS